MPEDFIINIGTGMRRVDIPAGPPSPELTERLDANDRARHLGASLARVTPFPADG